MRVTTAQLPEPPGGADRVFVTDHAVIVLDGASAFSARDVPAATYAEHLGSTLAGLIEADERSGLDNLLATAIEETATTLDIRPGPGAPSSTVAICRLDSGETVDLLVLGDSQIATPGRIFRDGRLGLIASEQRAAYQARLRAGGGYDEKHHALLGALQDEQLRHRNRPGGYWIAEADPKAAQHALTWRGTRRDVPWCVLATDGAYRSMEHNDWDNWAWVADRDAVDLLALLDRCQRWEAADPDGNALPRAKRHDDKTLAVGHL